MSQNTSVESSTRQSINPALQAALGSLDVHLEEELARYRRQRAGRPVIHPRGLGRHQIRKPIELISVDKAKGKTQQPALGMSTAPTISFPLAMGNQTPADAPPKETNREPLAQSGQLDVRSSAASEPVDAPVVAYPTNAAANKSATEESVSEQLTPPKEPADHRGDLVSVGADQAQPDDYLESSEQLLRSLSEEEVSVEPQKRFTDRLLTPLGIGSILLLLLSSATLAYIVNNPSTLSSLGLGRFFGSKAATKTQSPTETTRANRASVKGSPTVEGPNLATDEFVDLNLNTLSRLEGSPTPSPSGSPVPPIPDLPNSEVTPAAPSVVPNSQLPRRSSDLSSKLLPPSLQPGVASSPVAPLPAPAAPTATNKPESSFSAAQVAESPPPAGDKFYYVLVDSTNDRALEQTRKVVPDAYVRNFPQGNRIQMGAFLRESEATTLVEQLKQQGISASIYRP
jgi:hypothetical protein